MSAKKNLNITWLHDYYNCDTCGGNSAEGVRCTDADTGELIYEFEPVAHCFDSSDQNADASFKEILKALGYSVIFDCEFTDDN